MIEFISQCIGEYIVVFLGLVILKALGWFGMGSVAFGLLFGIALAPVVLNVLWFLIVLLAGLLAVSVDRVRKADR